MARVRLADGNTLLTYALTTQPDPFMASSTNPSVPGSYGSLVVTATPPDGTTIYCTEFAITLPIALTSDGPVDDPTTSTPGWTVAYDSNSGSVTATNDDPSTALTTPVVVQIGPFLVKPSAATESISIPISESASTTSPTDPPTQTGSINLTVVPYGFFFGNFSASTPAVTRGGSVTLSWIGAVDAQYLVYWDESEHEDVSDKRVWPSPPLAHDTTFILRAQDATRGLLAEETVTVTVVEPDLVANTLTADSVTVQAQLTAEANATINGTLTCASPATFEQGFGADGSGGHSITLKPDLRILGSDTSSVAKLGIGNSGTLTARIDVIGTAANLQIGPDGTDANTISSTADLNLSSAGGAFDVNIDAGTDCNISCTRTVNLKSSVAGVFTFNQRDALNKRDHINAAITVNDGQNAAGVLLLFPRNPVNGNPFVALGAQSSNGGSETTAELSLGDEPNPKQAGFIHLKEGFFCWGVDFLEVLPGEPPPSHDTVGGLLRGMLASSRSAMHHGRGELRDGYAIVELPTHFARRIDPATMTVHLTPESADSKGLAVVSKSGHGFEIRELHQGTGSYPFSFIAVAGRK